MVKITLSSLNPSSIPAEGWKVGYKIKGSASAYTIAGPFMTAPIEINTTDPAGTLYEGYIVRDCGSLDSAQYFWTTPCNCVGSGYVMAPDETQCQKVDTVPASVTSSGYCLAPSTHNSYSSYGTRIYNPGYGSLTMALPPGSSGPLIYGVINAGTQWANTGGSTTIGPLNREGVWIDSDCNGVRDPLGLGVETTIAFQYNHVGAPQTIHIGIAADNGFHLYVNGVSKGFLEPADGLGNFRFWHVVPVDVVTGLNYINAVAVGDGSVQDSIGLVGYKNTAAEIFAATSDAALNILFKSSNLRGTTYDVATCPDGYSLDTSGGSGGYICVKTLYKICNSIS